MHVHPAKDEESPSAPSHPHYILQKHNREHFDQLHLCEVWRLQCFRLEECEYSGEDSRENHWDSIGTLGYYLKFSLRVHVGCRNES